MNLTFKGLGAEPKKMAVLGGLALVLGYLFYSNVLAPSSDAPPVRQQRVVEAATAVAPAPETRSRPPLLPGPKAPRPETRMSGAREKGPDPASIDPTLRLDLLAKVQAVGLAGGGRNLFQFGADPTPQKPEPKILVSPMLPAVNPNAPPVEPPKPPPPPIALKFYGYAGNAPSGAKRVFFLDGDDIFVAAEGDLVKSRYKVVRVGVNSVVVEDAQYHNQQTFALEEQPK